MGSQSVTPSACLRSHTTTAAVAGAIAGVYYGFGAIPPEWVGRLRGKAVIDQCL